MDRGCGIARPSRFEKQQDVTCKHYDTIVVGTGQAGPRWRSTQRRKDGHSSGRKYFAEGLASIPAAFPDQKRWWRTLCRVVFGASGSNFGVKIPCDITSQDMKAVKARKDHVSACRGQGSSSR